MFCKMHEKIKIVVMCCIQYAANMVIWEVIILNEKKNNANTKVMD